MTINFANRPIFFKLTGFDGKDANEYWLNVNHITCVKLLKDRAIVQFLDNENVVITIKDAENLKDILNPININEKEMPDNYSPPNIFLI